MFSETVASLFASLDLDASRLPEQLAEAKTALGNASRDMTLSLASLEKAYADVTGMMTAQEAALHQLGISDLSSTAARAEALELLIDKQKAWLALIEKQEAAVVRREAAMATITDEVLQSEKLKQRMEIETAATTQQLLAERMAAEKALNAESAAEVKRIASVHAEGLAEQAASEREYSALVKDLRAQEAAAAKLASEAEIEAARIRNAVLIEEAKAQESAYIAILEEEKAASLAAGGSGIPGSFGGGIGKGGISPRASLSGGAGLGIAAGAFGLYEVSKQAAEFDDAMNKSLSIMGEVSDAMKGKMSNAAKELAAQYGISGTEIAHTFYNLASSGMSAEQALTALPTVVKFAFTASSDGIMKTEKSAEMLTTVVNALQGSGGSIEHVANLLLEADRIAAGTGEQFAKSLAGKGAGAIRILGKDLEEGLAILTTFSVLGIRGADAQTALVQVLRDFRVQAERHKDVMVTLNGQTMTYGDLVYDSSGKMKNMADILRELETLFKGASSQTISHDLALLGLNQRTTQITQAIVGFSEKMMENEKILRNTGDTLQEITEKRLESAMTKFRQFKETVRDGAIDLGDVALPVLTKIAKVLADVAGGLNAATKGDSSLGGRFDKYGMAHYYEGKSLPSEQNYPDPQERLAELKAYSKGAMLYAQQFDIMSIQGTAASSAAAEATVKIGLLKDQIARGEALLKRIQDEIAPHAEATGANSVTDPKDAERIARAADKAAQERNRIAAVELQADHDHEMSKLKMEADAIKAKEGLVGHNADETFALLQAVHRKELDEITTFNQKRLDLEFTKKTPVYAAEVVKNNRAGEDQVAALDQASGLHAEASDRKHEDAIAHFHKFVQDLMDTDDRKAEQQNLKLQNKLTDDNLSALKAQAQGELAHTTNLLEMWRQRADYAYRIGQIDADQHKSIIKVIEDAEEAAAIKAINREIELLKLRKDTTTDYATQLQALENRKQALLDAAQGKAQKSNDIIKGLSTSMQYMERQSESAIRAFSSGMSDLIVDGGKFGDQMTKTAKNIAKTLIQDVVQFGFGTLLRTIGTTGSELDKLGRKMQGIFINATKTGAATVDVSTPPFMQANTDALAKNTDQTGKDASAVTKDTAATVGGTAASKVGSGRTSENTDATSGNTNSLGENTGELKLNTLALKALTAELHLNTASEDLNTVATNENTAALLGLTAALLRSMIKLPGGSGGGLGFNIDFGGGGYGGLTNPYSLYGGNGGFNPYSGSYGGIGGINPFDPFAPYVTGQGANKQYDNILSFDSVRSDKDLTPTGSSQALIDMRGSTFTGVTEDLVTSMMTKAVSKMRANRARM